ncbi:dityrosine transporter [Kwoniella heveanensis BCC8398]|uniref:Dityrosine transporter n=1 Tax=Kwoniella heveanensis BCC8398 TaxID=1296120 RepID=A0A1B9GRE6_9TREE|nr:dityrosine transporter [Kwoniella heveanensis BCC8398]
MAGQCSTTDTPTATIPTRPGVLDVTPGSSTSTLQNLDIDPKKESNETEMAQRNTTCSRGSYGSSGTLGDRNPSLAPRMDNGVAEKDFAEDGLNITMPIEAERQQGGAGRHDDIGLVRSKALGPGTGTAGPSVLGAGRGKSNCGTGNDRSDDDDDEKRDRDLGTHEQEIEVEMIDGRPRDIYDRFTRAKKVRILLIVAYSAIIAPMTSSIFLPAIPLMAGDLHTSTKVINYTVAVFILVIGIAPVLWSPYAGFYGRKPVYLASMPIMVVASIGVSQCHNVAALVGTRVLQGIGSSCFLAVGAGSIGDIYRPTERARAMSSFYMMTLMGPALSPVLAGIFAEYTPATWRTSQYFLAGCGALSVFLVYFFLPETSHPPLPHDVLKQEKGQKFVVYFCNPFKSIALVRWPNIAIACFISSCGMIDTYCVLVPLSTVFRDRYHITNLALGGTLYLISGAGNIIGSKFIGPLADKTVKRYIEKRGYRRPEDRLRCAFFGLGVLMPVSVLVYGWLVETGAGGMAPPLIMVFFNGIALMLGFAPLNTYLVDSMETRSAEVIAVNNCIRYIFAAIASAVILPIADAIGWGWSMTICAILTWISAFSLWLLYRYGDKWREAANRRHGVTRRQADEEKIDEGRDEEGIIGGGTGVDSQHQPQQEIGGRRSTIEKVSEEEGGNDKESHEHPGPIRNPHPNPISLQRSHSRKESTKLTKTGNRLELGQVQRHTSTTGRGEMPPVEQVLKRTVSLSGTSVHGGG